MRRLFAILLLILACQFSYASTSILVSKSASTSNATYIGHVCDESTVSPPAYFPLLQHQTNVFVPVFDSQTGEFKDSIKQIEETFTVVESINSRQTSIAWSSFPIKENISSKEGSLDIQNLISLCLQQAKNARHAIKTIDVLTRTYGFYGGGYNLAIGDPREVWIMSIIGTDLDAHKSVWVAQKVPEGYVSVLTNNSRIRTFALHDGANSLYSRNLFSYAKENNLYSGAPESLDFTQTFANQNTATFKQTNAQVWSILSRLNPTLSLELEQKDLPLWVKPIFPLELENVKDLLRNHYEFTSIEVSPKAFGNHKSIYTHKPISHIGVSYSFIAELRDWMPYPIGGVLWYSQQDNYLSTYHPLYCGINALPSFYSNTELYKKYQAKFQLIIENTYADFSIKSPLIVEKQESLEKLFRAKQIQTDSLLAELYTTQPDLSLKTATTFCDSLLTELSIEWMKEAQALWPDFSLDSILLSAPLKELPPTN